MGRRQKEAVLKSHVGGITARLILFILGEHAEDKNGSLGYYYCTDNWLIPRIQGSKIIISESIAARKPVGICM